MPNERSTAAPFEERISSRMLAARLGITHEEVLALIKKHEAELLKFGPIIRTPIPPPDQEPDR